MLNITEEQKELFDSDIGNKEIILKLSKGNEICYIYNENIISESMELNEGISTEQNVRFGQCFSNRFSIDVFNIKEKFGTDKDFIGWNLEVYIQIHKDGDYIYPMNAVFPSDDGIYPNGTVTNDVRFPLFVGIVQDSKLADNRNNRKLTAYDILYFKLNTDMTNLYWNDFLANGRTYKYIREKILDSLGIPYEQIELVNDDKYAFIQDQVYTKLNAKITARVALESVLELCGCFGHINRYGVFVFKTLKKTWYNYPALKTNELVKYPTNTPPLLYLGRQSNYLSTEIEQLKTYIKCTYGENDTAKITGVQFIKNNNIIADKKIVSNNNIYISKGNIYLEYLPEGLQGISSYYSEDLYQQISELVYMPAQLQVSGKPYLEVGDYVYIELNNDDKDDIIFPVLQRNLKGIQSLKDTFSAKGTVYRKNSII